MTDHHLERLSSEVRLIISKFLLEDQKLDGDFLTATVEMLFDPESPFVSELGLLFPDLTFVETFTDASFYSDSVNLYRLPRNPTTAPVSEFELSDNSTPTYLAKRMARYTGDVRLSRPFHSITSIEPYAINVKSLSLLADNAGQWVEFVNSSSRSLEHLTLKECNAVSIVDLQNCTKEFPRLKSLQLAQVMARRVDRLTVLAHFLRAFGHLLETLDINVWRGEDAIDWELEGVENLCHVVYTYCPNLKEFPNPQFAHKYLLQRYGSQVRSATISMESEECRCFQLLEDCPHARFSFSDTFTNDHLDALDVMAPRIHGMLKFDCKGLVEMDVKKLKLCMSKLDSISEIWVDLRSSETEQSLFLDVLAEVKPRALETLTIHAGPLCTTSLWKMLPVMPMIRNLDIHCTKVGNEDALVQICATGTNLERVSLHVWKYFWASDKQKLQRAVSMFSRIINAVCSHPKLKSIDCTGDVHVSKVFEKLRDVVQCLRNRRVLVKCGTLTFLYGKGITSKASYLTSE